MLKIAKKYLKILLVFFIVCLIGIGVLYFFNAREENETRTQIAPNLKLFNSHSHPEAGDEWAVSFETMGPANLTITPTDPDSIGDLDFVSLRCNGKKKTEEEPLQILAGDVIFYSSWQCDGTGEVIHLVNIAGKHTLKFQFSNKIAFAYNNPDSVTDTFTDESKIDSKENLVVTGGQVMLAKPNGAVCSSGSECNSGYCADGVCCNTACTGSICQRCDSYSDAGAGTCGYISTAVDPDSECSASSCPVVLNSASGQTCTTKCAAQTENTGNCSGMGASCASDTTCVCVDGGTDAGGTNDMFYNYDPKLSCMTGIFSPSMVMDDMAHDCNGIAAAWAYCKCD